MNAETRKMIEELHTSTSVWSAGAEALHAISDRISDFPEESSTPEANRVVEMLAAISRSVRCFAGAADRLSRTIAATGEAGHKGEP